MKRRLPAAQRRTVLDVVVNQESAVQLERDRGVGGILRAAAERTSRLQNLQARLQSFVILNMTTRGAVLRRARVPGPVMRTWVPERGWK